MLEKENKMTTTNQTTTCTYANSCERFDFKSCSSISYMTNCDRLNEYLIQREESKLVIKQEDFREIDIGLVRFVEQLNIDGEGI